jgi:NADH-quinone oxidoreductase subunit A
MINYKEFALNIEYSPLKIDYLDLFIFLIFSTFLSVLIVLLSYFLSKQKPDSEKISPYECGFEPYDDTRHVFDVKFCVIAILFIVFDIEIMFLIPWCVSLAKLDLLGFWVMVDFLIELTVGFFYVWYSGALDLN